MNQGKLVFAQVMQHLPQTTFRRCASRYQGEYRVQSFSCLDQFLCMAFAQLTFRESLRDIEACLRAQRSKLYHLGIRSTVSRNTLANANAVRDWRIYADFAQSLIGIARPLYVDEPFGVDLKDTGLRARRDHHRPVFVGVSVGAVPIDQGCDQAAHAARSCAGISLTFIHISDGKLHEVSVLDQLLPEPGAFYILDRGFIDFTRLYRFHQAGSFFVIRAKSNTKAQRRYSNPVDRSTGVMCDQTILLTGMYSPQDYQAPLRRIRFRDPETDQVAGIPYEQFHAASTHDHRRSTAVAGKSNSSSSGSSNTCESRPSLATSENAVKSQIWIAVSVYVLVAIVKKRHKLPGSLYQILQILSLTVFERTPLHQLFTQAMIDDVDTASGKQLSLFD